MKRNLNFQELNDNSQLQNDYQPSTVSDEEDIPQVKGDISEVEVIPQAKTAVGQAETVMYKPDVATIQLTHQLSLLWKNQMTRDRYTLGEKNCEKCYETEKPSWFRNRIKTICKLNINPAYSFDATEHTDWSLNKVESSELHHFIMHNVDNCEFWLDQLEGCSNLLYLDISIPLSLWPRLVLLCSKLPIKQLRLVIFLPMEGIDHSCITISPPENIKIFNVYFETVSKFIPDIPLSDIPDTPLSYIPDTPLCNKTPIIIDMKNRGIEGFKFSFSGHLLKLYHFDIILPENPFLKVLYHFRSPGLRLQAFKKTFQIAKRIRGFSNDIIFFPELEESKTIKEVHKELCPSDCTLDDPLSC